MSKKYRVNSWGEEYNVYLTVAKYYNGNLAIEMKVAETYEPFARLTVNLDNKLADGLAYVDVNNCPWAEKFIEKYGLGEHQDKFAFSGYCMYPLYKFDMDKVRA